MGRVVGGEGLSAVRITMYGCCEAPQRLVEQHRESVQSARSKYEFYRLAGNRVSAMVEQVEFERALRTGVILETRLDRFARRWQAFGYDPDDEWEPSGEVEV